MAIWQIARRQAQVMGPGPGLASLGWLTVMTFLFGSRDLPAAACVRLLEGFCPVCGVFLMTGLFLPENDPGLRDSLAVRRVPYLGVCALRAACLALAAAGLCLAFAAFLALRGCAVQAAWLPGMCANALFLGALALLASTALGGVAAGAAAPLAWLLLDVLYGRMGPLSLLRYTLGRGMPASATLAGALVFLSAAFALRAARLRHGA